MLLDLGSVLSIGFYDYMLEVRYTGHVNFKDIFTYFEVLCVVYTVIDWIINITRREHSTLSAVDHHGRFATYFCKSRNKREKGTI